MSLPVRKRNRLKAFDYSTQAAYFITIQAKDRKNIFWENAEDKVVDKAQIRLSVVGRIVEKAIRMIGERYTWAIAEKFVIMPNHVHILLRLEKSDEDWKICSVSTVIQQMKGYATKSAGFSLWQKSFHDHVVRGERDYLKIMEYIENNPIRWKEDCYYSDNE